MKTPSFVWQALALAALALAGSNASAYTLSPDCGELYGTGSYGPFDFRTNPNEIIVVVTHHFTPDVEKLIRARSGTLSSDLSYTLVALPNYHRALVSMMRLSDRMKTDKFADARYSLSCFFARAIEFRPDDLIVRMLYAEYLTKRDRKAEAIDQLDYVGTQADPDNPLSQYNLARLYLSAGELDKAALRTAKAEALGHPVADLRQQLTAAGHPLPPAGSASAAEVAAQATPPASAASR
jgi:tetratricopeptide (TPR) repeat protein